MPQVFQVLRCYQCLVFQVHQVKKKNKFECKLCGEKQSLKKRYGIGTAKDCRSHVQRLNGIRGDIDEQNQLENSDSEDENESTNKEVKSNRIENRPSKKSKWSDYVDKKEEEAKSRPEAETMYLNNIEVVLELPKKPKRTNFKCPSLKTSTETVQNHSIVHEQNMTGQLLHNKNNTNCVTFANSKPENSKKPLHLNESPSKIELQTEINNKLNWSPNVNLKNEAVKKYTPPAMSSISKWAQFVEELYEEEDENATLTNENEDLTPQDNINKSDVAVCYKPLASQKIPQELFALCDDSDLDSVLDI